MTKEKLLSVCVITYNQENYIRECLDGIMRQKTDFLFQVLINDDASTDGTPDIIKEYEAKYPDIIKPIYQKTNQYSKGKGILRDFIFPRIDTQYVALCEGDDYWTDPYKLQKQVDFLQTHPDYSIVFHPVQERWEQGEHHAGYWGPNEMQQQNLDETIWQANIIPTLSVMYRWRLHGENMSLWPYGVAPGDWYLHLLHAQIGKIGFIPEMMGVYRKHPGGIWYGENKTEQFFIRYFWPRILFCEQAKIQFNRDFTFIEAELLFHLLRFCEKQNNYALLNRLRSENEEKWGKLNQNVKEYFSVYPSHNLFLSWLCYKLSIGKKREKYKKWYHFARMKAQIEKQSSRFV